MTGHGWEEVYSVQTDKDALYSSTSESSTCACDLQCVTMTKHPPYKIIKLPNYEK